MTVLLFGMNSSFGTKTKSHQALDFNKIKYNPSVT